jgi:hypothetical protein
MRGLTQINIHFRPIENAPSDSSLHHAGPLPWLPVESFYCLIWPTRDAVWLLIVERYRGGGWALGYSGSVGREALA